MTSAELLKIYEVLFKKIGPRGWWPADTPFEVMIGAILAQNTAWKNVKKAIDNLKEANLLEPERLWQIDDQALAALIKPSGYYNQKVRKIKNFLNYFMNHYNGSIESMGSTETQVLRHELLSINGVGPETADSILLYALNKPVFVVDAYTRRIFTRHGWVAEKISYQDLQAFFHSRLPLDVKLFNEFHALIDYVGHFYCRKVPRCEECPLQPFLDHSLNPETYPSEEI